MLAGNPGLCTASDRRCTTVNGGRRAAGARAAMVVLLSVAVALLLTALYIMVGGTKRFCGPHRDKGDIECSEDDVEMGPPWEVTLYQKLDLSISDVARSMTGGNIIGRGRSGCVYRVLLPSGLTIAVKKLLSSEKTSAAFFASEIATLGRIRHRNIVRLLGWTANRKTKLLFYDYLNNGTLGALLHEGKASGAVVEWDTRFKIALGIAEGLAYLHHDCVPPIVHRDVKVHNILLGDRYEPFLADFGLARLVEDQSGTLIENQQFAGSYGYMAPENAYSIKITEKSDVYSYGVVLLEIITGKRPTDVSFPEGYHVVQWVREHLKSKRDPVEIIDAKLHGHRDIQIQEMLQALGIALLCTSNRLEDRPTMKDVAVLLKEIRHEPPNGSEAQKPSNDIAKMQENSTNNSTSASLTQSQLLLMQASSNSSLAYSTSSTNYPS